MKKMESSDLHYLYSTGTSVAKITNWREKNLGISLFILSAGLNYI